MTEAWEPDPLARYDQASREGAVAVVVAQLGLAVIGLWWVDTGAGSLHTLADQLTAVGRITGLVGTYLLLIEVLLLARIPWLDALIGMDRLVVWHRRNGEYVVSLLVVHTVAITVGYAMTDDKSVMGEATTLLRHYPDMLSATVALGLLLAIGLSSVRLLRTRLRYQTWYFVHLYVYLAVALSFAHQLAAGDEFVDHRLNRWLWVFLHLGTAGLLVVHRVVVPLRSALRHRLRIDRIVDEGAGVVSAYITGRHMEELRGEPGQFFLWRLLTRSGWWEAHPYSLSAPPDGRELRITVKAAGDHSAALANARPGTPVLAEGPYGAMTSRRRSRRKALLLAGGIGAAPLRALFATMPAPPGDLTFVYRARTEADLVLRGELERIARRRRARLIYALGQRHGAQDPLDPAVLAGQIPDIADHDAFVCGSASFVDHAVASLVAAGVPRRHVHAERFEL